MVISGRATKRTTKKRRKKVRRFKTKTIYINPRTTATAAVNHRKNISELVPHIISATSAAQSFLLRHDLHHLLPRQSLSLESLLSSTSLSLSKLRSLLSLPTLPPTSPPHSPPLQTWFNKFLSFPDYDPRWALFFNLSKPSFTLLLRLLTPFLSSLQPLPPNAALAATLFRLAHGASFSAVARRFGLDSRAACRVFYTVIKAIVDNLGHLFEFSSDINRVIVGFGWISLPNCCGVLGVERFGLTGNVVDESENENGCLLVQALVDSEGRFLDVSAGWPGSEKPDAILRKSKLFSGVEESKEYLNGPSFGCDGYSIPQYVLGGSCYGLLPWLLTPYDERNGDLSYVEMAFNEVHQGGLKLVGEAFAKVKKRWKLLAKKRKGQCVEALPFVIVSCCLLHNFLIKCSEALPEEDEELLMGREFPTYEGEDDDRGKSIRYVLAAHLSRVSQRA